MNKYRLFDIGDFGWFCIVVIVISWISYHYESNDKDAIKALEKRIEKLEAKERK